MAEDIKPRGRPKKNPKYTWQVTSEGIIPVEVRFHQGNYKTFKYENGKTTMLKTVNTPLFDSLEEAVEAGGILPDEQVQVSGVPYTVSAKDVDVPSAVDDAADVMSDYENGEN